LKNIFKLWQHLITLLKNEFLFMLQPLEKLVEQNLFHIQY